LFVATVHIWQKLKFRDCRTFGRANGGGAFELVHARLSGFKLASRSRLPTKIKTIQAKNQNPRQRRRCSLVKRLADTLEHAHARTH